MPEPVGSGATTSPRRRRLVVAGIVVAVGVVLAVVLATRNPGSSNEGGSPARGATSAAGGRLETATRRLRSVPAAIAAGGVAVVDSTGTVVMYLRRATAPRGAITRVAAEHDALEIDLAPGLSVTNVVFASVTLPDEVPAAGAEPSRGAVIGTAAWVVTVTSPQPVSAPGACSDTTGTACRTPRVTNNYLILDATTGRLLGSAYS